MLKILPKMLSGISQIFTYYANYACIMLPKKTTVFFTAMLKVNVALEYFTTK